MFLLGEREREREREKSKFPSVTLRSFRSRLRVRRRGGTYAKMAKEFGVKRYEMMEERRKGGSREGKEEKGRKQGVLPPEPRGIQS